MKACTVVRLCDLPRARVLAQSYSDHHRNERLTVLVSDDRSEQTDPTAEPFDLIRLRDLDIDDAQVRRLALLHEPAPLAAALTPHLVAALQSHSGATVLYLDSSSLVLGSLDELGALANRHGIVVPARATAIPPRDSMWPTGQALVDAGVVSDAWVCVSGDAREALAWTSAVRHGGGESDGIAWKLLLDRIDASVHLLRDNAYALSAWNAHEGSIGDGDGALHINGVAVRIAHFDGFDPERPHVIHDGPGPRPRILLSEHPALARLYARYSELLHAGGWDDEHDLNDGWGRLHGGIPVDARIRRIYARALADPRPRPDPPEPFDPEQPHSMSRWLREPELKGGITSRYLMEVWRESTHLQTLHPSPLGAGGLPFIDWLRSGGYRDVSAPVEMLPTESEIRAWRAQVASPNELTRGMTVCGYFLAESGVGELGRRILRAAEGAAIPVSVLGNRNAPQRQQLRFDHREGRADRTVNLLCINADQLPLFAADAGTDFFRGRYTVGHWAWEASPLPQSQHGAFDYVDEIWVGSQYLCDVFGAAGRKPVYLFPLPIDVPETLPTPDRARFGIPEGYTFLFMFDLLSVMERKNPLGLIRAFTAAFDRRDDVNLVIKTINGDLKIGDLERLRAAARAHPRIKVIDGYFSPDDTTLLTATCDAYVSLHRSEGHGLTMIEAMAFGKPVIATGYSGNLAFMNDANSYLVGHTLVEIPPGCDPYPVGGVWAEPSVDDAARLMREVAASPASASERGTRAREYLRQNHTLAHLGEFMVNRLAEIDVDGRRRRATVFARGAALLGRRISSGNGAADR